MRDYLRALARLGVRRLVLVGGLTVAAAGTEGAGLLLLVPLLGLAGIAPGGPGSAGASMLPASVHVGLPVVLVAFLVAAAGRALLVRGRDLQAARLRLDFVDDLRLRLYAAAARAQWQHLAAIRRSDLLQALTADVLRVAAGTQVVFELVVAAVLASVYVAVAGTLSPLGTVAAGAVAALMVAAAVPQLRRARRLGGRLTERNRRLYATATEFLDGIKTAKAAGGEAAAVHAFDEQLRGEREAMLGYQRASSGLAAANAVGSAAVLTATVVVAVAWLAIPPASLLVLVLVFVRLLSLAAALVQRAQHVATMLPAFAGVTAMLRSCESAAEPVAVPGVRVAPPRTGVRLRSVTVRFGPDRPAALVDVDVAVPARAVTAVVGPSGAGKSTLADVLCGLLPPAIGRLEVDGVAITGPLVRAWRDQIAYVPQEATLVPGTVAGNLRRCRPGASDAELWAALRVAAAEKFVAALPAGLATEVGDRGVQLSGGERQRISIAGALLRRPSLLVLDESTSALDGEHERDVHDALLALRGELTLVVIAHRLTTVRTADRIVVLDHGRVVETGTWDDLSGRAGGRLRALAAASGLAPRGQGSARG